MPKCPFCVAALLSTLGLGAASAAFLAPLVRPLAIALALACGAALLWSVLSPRRSCP